MATFAARRLHDMLDNVNAIVSIELLAAAQGIEFHRPKRTAPALERALTIIRGVSPPLEADRSLAPDIARVAALVDEGAFRGYAASILPGNGA